jgi:hypothetical protein
LRDRPAKPAGIARSGQTADALDKSKTVRPAPNNACDQHDLFVAARQGGKCHAPSACALYVKAYALICVILVRI